MISKFAFAVNPTYLVVSATVARTVYFPAVVGTSSVYVSSLVPVTLYSIVISGLYDSSSVGDVISTFAVTVSFASTNSVASFSPLYVFTVPAA